MGTRATRWGTITTPGGSYPALFLAYLFFHIAEPNHKTRDPKQGQGITGYDFLGQGDERYATTCLF